VADELGRSCGLPPRDTPLPGLLLPGQEAVAAMRVFVPATVGTYQVALLAVRPSARDQGARALPEGWPANSFFSEESTLRLFVEPAAARTEDRCCDASLQAVHRALIAAECRQHLPAEYVDVTQGFLGKWKSWIKRKLLGNFKHAYVDVLSRQQSAFNSQTLRALQELAECCALLDQALAAGNASNRPNAAEPLSRALGDGDLSSLAASIERTVAAGKASELALVLHNLADQLAEARQRLAALQARLSRLEERERSAERGALQNTVGR